MVPSGNRFRAAVAATAFVILTAYPGKAVAQQVSMGTQISDAVQPYLENHSIAGAVSLVTDKNQTTDIRAFGYSDLATQKPMETNAIFWIASMSKPITAVALMMLVDQGKVHLDDPVQKYLPDFQPRILDVSGDGKSLELKQPQTMITIRELLDHTSGVPFASAIEAHGADRYQLSMRVKSYALTPLQFEPGTDYQYSSAGITVIGRVVEVTSGMPFEAFLKKSLFDPLEMSDTGFLVPANDLSRVAVTYFADGSGNLRAIQPRRIHKPYSDGVSRYAFPGGGLFSTAEDLAKFCRMILNNGVISGHRYLSDGAIDEMTKNQVPETIRENAEFPVGEGYGLGWMIAGDRVGHAGSDGTNMDIDQRAGIAAIWMVQVNDAVGGSVAARKAFERAVFRQ